MPIIDDQELYDKVKKYASSIYPKSSAFRSGFIVKTYKQLGGTYTDDNKPKKLKQWYQEKWKSVGGEYPTFRPTIRINKTTPLLPSEIDPKNLKNQITEKQKIKGEKNLSPFKKK